MEKFTEKLLAIIGCVGFIGIITIYSVETTQYAKKHRERNNKIENSEKIKEFQFSCMRGDTTEYHANITYRGDQANLVKAIHEFRIYLLNKSLGTREDELHNLDTLKQTIESYNVIPVSIMLRIAGVDWDE